MKNTINTKQLFLERLSPADRDEHQPPFSIQEHDVVRAGKTYKSMYQLFISSVDEYSFAFEHLGGMASWAKLLNTLWFTEGYRSHRGIEAWRDDMRSRDESTAKKTLLLAVSEGDVGAARKLFDISKKPTESKRGRFKKEEVIKEAAKSVEDKEFLHNAATRLNVVSIMD